MARVVNISGPTVVDLYLKLKILQELRKARVVGARWGQQENEREATSLKENIPPTPPIRENTPSEEKEKETHTFLRAHEDSLGKVLEGELVKYITGVLRTASKPKFVPPTIDEVKAFCTERQNGVDAEHWYAWYKAKGWKIGKTPMVDWRQAIITWEKTKSDKKPLAASELRRRDMRGRVPENYL